LIDLATLDSLGGIKRHVRKAAATIPTREHPESTSTPAQVAALENEIQQLQNVSILKRCIVQTRDHITSRSGYGRMVTHKILISSSNGFLLMANCLNTPVEDCMKRNCGPLATLRKIYICFKVPGKQCCLAASGNEEE
jgi:hypothetical protein